MRGWWLPPPAHLSTGWVWKRLLPLLMTLLFTTLAVAGPPSEPIERLPRSVYTRFERLPREVHLEGQWLFHPGDDLGWAAPALDESGWETQPVPGKWEENGHPDLDGYAWYRVHFRLPPDEVLRPLGVELGQIDDADEVFLNGTWIGRTGGFPPQIRPAPNVRRVYPLPARHLNWGADNVLAVRIFDASGSGGLLRGEFRIGDYADVYQRYSVVTLLKILCPTLFLLFGVYHILLGLLRRSRTDLWFAGWSLVVAVLSFCRSPLPHDWSMDPLLRQRLFYYSLFGIGPLFHHFASRHFNLDVGPWRRWVDAISVVVVLVITFSERIALWFWLFYLLGQPLLLILLLHCLWMVNGARLRGDPEAGPFLISGFFLAIITVVELVANTFRLNLPDMVNPGLLMFDVAMLTMLARRYVRISSEVRALNVTLERRVTERTSQLELARAEVVARNQELSQFTWVVSHDLREPLRGIENLVVFLEEDLGEDIPDSAHTHLGRLRGQVQRLQVMVKDLLHLSTLTMGTLPKLERVDLSTLIPQVVDELKLSWPRQRVEVHIHGTMPQVMGVPALLEEVIRNLLVNAERYCTREMADIHIRSRNLPYGLAEITVEDNGIGISPTSLEKIFEPFHRLDPTDQRGGSGLGLTICRKVLHRLGGEISVTSTPGLGSTFTMTLHTTPPG